MTEQDLKDTKIRIKLLVTKKGLTQEQLSEYLKMSQSSVSKMLNPNNSASLTLEMLMKLSDLFDCGIDFLLTGSNYKRKRTSDVDLKDIAKLIVEWTGKNFVYIEGSHDDSEPYIRIGNILGSHELKEFLKSFKQLNILRIKGSIDETIFNVAVDALIEKLPNFADLYLPEV